MKRYTITRFEGECVVAVTWNGVTRDINPLVKWDRLKLLTGGTNYDFGTKALLSDCATLAGVIMLDLGYNDVLVTDHMQQMGTTLFHRMPEEGFQVNERQILEWVTRRITGDFTALNKWIDRTWKTTT